MVKSSTLAKYWKACLIISKELKTLNKTTKQTLARPCWVSVRLYVLIACRMCILNKCTVVRHFSLKMAYILNKILHQWSVKLGTSQTPEIILLILYGHVHCLRQKTGYFVQHFKSKVLTFDD